VTGVDLSENAIAFAKAFNPDAEIICKSIYDLSKKYQMVTVIEVLEHIEDKKIEEFVESLTKVMFLDTHLLVTVPTINVPLNKKHYRHYNLKKLIDSFNPYFYLKEHWWLYRQGNSERILRKLLCNKLFLLNYVPILKVIWKIHLRYTFYGDNRTGTHLVGLFYLRK
jgi:2-polyprenyl-3-methyl-5-hydroxy-6-metoxy-1,4-benzoquinol methylase